MVRSVRSPLGNGGGGGETSLFTQLASMSDMRTLLKQLVEDGSDKWGVALVVGAGTGAKLPLLRQLGAKHLLLAEAHPRQRSEEHTSELQSLMRTSYAVFCLKKKKKQKNKHINYRLQERTD